MKKKIGFFLSFCLVLAGTWFVVDFFFNSTNSSLARENEKMIELPSPVTTGDLSVEEAIARRRSVRRYQDAPLTLAEVSNLLWAASGITSERGKKSIPSAGALYPLDVYLAVGEVENLAPAIYRYNPENHSLVKVVEGDKRQELFEAALSQGFVASAPVSLVVCADYATTTRRYGRRGEMYVHIEVGHLGQNIYLQAESLGLATVAVGAFGDEQVKDILQVQQDPLYIMPVGRK